MRGYLLSILLMFSVLSGTARADEAAVRDVIVSQIDAFQRDDFERAFSYASPFIQSRLGTYERFRSMVRGGYPMVWRPTSIRFAQYDEDEGRFYQNVLLGDDLGDLHMARYEVIMVEGEWRINGVQLVEQPGLGA